MANEKVIKVKCINSGGFRNLETSEKYYVCAAGPNNYYVSRFPNVKKTLMGSYPQELFELIAGSEIEVRKEVATAAANAKRFEAQQMSLF